MLKIAKKFSPYDPKKSQNLAKNRHIWSLCLNKTSLDVSSLGGFDGRVNKTFTTSHSVKIKLGWSQTGQIGIFNESSGFWSVIVFYKMG